MKHGKNFTWIIVATSIIILTLAGVSVGLTIVKNQEISDAEQRFNQPTPTPAMVVESSVNLDGRLLADNGILQLDDVKKTAILDYDYQLKGLATDITIDQSAGVEITSLTSALVKIIYQGGEFSLIATVDELPVAPEGKYYQGWLLDTQTNEYVSVGKLLYENEKFINAYVSSTDYTPFLYYVITLQDESEEAAKPGDLLLGGKIFVID